MVRHPDRYVPERGTLRQYLLGAVRNLSRKRWRKKTESSVAGTADVADTAQTPEALASNQQIRDVVATAIWQLPEQQREVILLAHYEQMPVAAIASMLEIEQGAVKSRLQRARAALRVMLGPLQIEKPRR